MAGGENEAVAIRPFRILGVEVHELGEEDVGHGSGAERQTGVAGVCGLHRVDGEDAQGIDGFGFELSVERGESDGGQENLLERRRGRRKSTRAGEIESDRQRGIPRIWKVSHVLVRRSAKSWWTGRALEWR